MRALVLSAGYGTRLGGLTADTPKPMLDVAGRPMIELILGHLADHGIREIAVNLHFRPETIRDRLGDGSRLGVELTYSEEPELLGTAGSVRSLGEFLAAEGDFLVQYGDVVTDQPIAPVVELHRRAGATLTALVHERPGSNSVAVVEPDGRVSAFLERPSEAERRGVESAWAFSGLCVCSPGVIEAIPREGASDLPRDVFPRLVAEGRLFAQPLAGYRIAVDSPERLESLRNAVAAGRLGAQPT